MLQRQLSRDRSPWMTEDLDQLRELAATFCDKELTPHQQRWAEQHHVDRELWYKAGKTGLLCMSIPEEYGGGGGTFAHEAVLLGEQARVLDTSFGNAVHSGIVAHYLFNYATAEQKKQWLPAMASGELVGAIAMTEPGAGSDLQSIRTRAVKDGDSYLLNGAKTFISNGSQAELIIVVAKTDQQLGAHGISLFVVETKQVEGFRRGRVLDKIGLHGQDTAELFFDDVRIPTANLLGGKEGAGFGQLMTQLPQERLLIAVSAVGAMARAVELAIDYAKQRQAFGKELLGLQHVRFELAECATQVAVTRAFLDQCIQQHLVGELDVSAAAMVKWWTTEQQCQVVDRCLQLFGGYGYMSEYPISRMWVDARVQKIYGGANEIMKELIARAL